MRLMFFLCLFSSVLWSNNSGDESLDEFSGVFNISVPANRLLKSFELSVDLSAITTVVSSVETQGNPEEMEETITVGQGLSMRFKRDYKQRIHYKSEKTAYSEAWFYLYGRADRVTGFSILPDVYVKEDDSTLQGVTEPVFALDLYEVSKPGETIGTLVSTIEHISFNIGEYNDIMFRYEIKEGRRFAVRLYAMETEESHLISFHSSKLGIYPGKLLKADKTEVNFYRPQVRFYLEKNNQSDKINKNKVVQRLTDEINDYIRNSDKYGQDVRLEVPLALNMRLAPEGSTHYQIKSGPPAPPRKAEPKKKKKFLGL